MDWLLQNLPLLVLGFVVFSIFRAISRAREANAKHEAGADQTDEQRHVREVQDQIRRKIAERRGERAPAPPPPVLRPSAAESRPILRLPQPVPPLDPFGGPVARQIKELERRVAPPPAPVPEADTRRAELERQARLAEEMRAIEEARVIEQRRAARQLAARDEAAASEDGLRTSTRERLLVDLNDPQGLRRAFLLREVLGAPVGLR